MKMKPILCASRLLLAAAGIVFLTGDMPVHAANLVIATVDNSHMLQMQTLSKAFEKTHPDIRIRWVTLKEHELRQFVSTNISTKANQIDIMTVGMYEVPIWAKRGLIKPIRPEILSDRDDLLPNIREGLSYQGQIYAMPIYGESSMLMYRKDLMRKAGLTMPGRPTWAQIARMAKKLNDPAHQVHGICLRGAPGWGENITLITTMVNAFGGQWFDMHWQPQLESKPWKEAVTLYVELLTKYGPKNSVAMGYNDYLALFKAGRCAIWLDASVAAAFVTDPKQSQVAHSVGFAMAPSAITSKGSQWLWAWALAIAADIDPANEIAAQKFVNWATSREYVKLVASHSGWGMVPSGTRKSTYLNPQFQRAAAWANFELKAIQQTDPKNATLPKSPYVGVQFAVIPEFRFIGDAVGKLIADAVSGQISVNEALSRSQYVAKRQMLLGGYMQAAEADPKCNKSNASQMCQ